MRHDGGEITFEETGPASGSDGVLVQILQQVDDPAFSLAAPTHARAPRGVGQRQRVGALVTRMGPHPVPHRRALGGAAASSAPYAGFARVVVAPKPAQRLWSDRNPDLQLNAGYERE